MALNIKTLGTRALTALVFVLVLLGCLLWNYTSFSVFFFIVSLMGLNEFYKLSEKLNAQPYKITGFILGVLTYACFFLPFWNFQFMLILVPFIVFLTALLNTRDNPVQNALFTLAGIIYSVIPFGLLHYLVFKGDILFPEFSPYLVFALILLIWSNDTFAYLGGSLFGKHKMIARISPGKTWEGTVFGVAMTIGLGYVIGEYFFTSNKMLWIILGFSVPVLATLGDLVESMLKRQAGIKDTGNIMPGHGGILDRFDSLIFVSPFVFVIVKLIALPSVSG